MRAGEMGAGCEEEREPLWSEALATLAQAAETMAALHARGLVHCDLKPAHLLVVQRDGPVRRRLDPVILGVSAMVSTRGQSFQRMPGDLRGTPAFMAPEQAPPEESSEGPALDGRCDVYALGGVMFELFSGELPFQGGNLLEVLARRWMEQAPSLGALAPRVPAPIRDLVDRMLARQRGDRPDMAEVASRLSELAKASGDEPMPPVERNKPTGEYQVSAPEDELALVDEETDPAG
ncbi:MAG: protein kinase [Polyangiaceae bacterium]